MDDQKRKSIFDFFRKNPYASPSDISKEVDVDYTELLREMDSNKQFRKSIESILDIREGRVGP